MNEHDRLLTLKQASKEFDLSIASIRNAIRRKDILSYSPSSGRKLWVKKSELENWILGNECH